MAIQQLYGKQNLAPTLGYSLGAGLGQGLSMLLNNKVQDIARQKRAQEWEGIGLPSNVAQFLVNQPESIQKSFLDRLEGFNVAAPGSQQTIQPEARSLSNAEPTQQSSSTLAFGPTKEGQKAIQHAFKETKEFRHNILERKKTARQELHDLNRLEELSESGKLDTPGYVEFLKRSGLDIPALTNPESEEFQKIQQGFLKSAKQYFGNRISNYEVEQFLKTIPSLSQSPEGRKRVIANLKYIARGAEEYYKAYQDVLKETKGVPTLDIEDKVEEKAEKRLEAVAKQFKKDLAKPVPKGQNKVITALQAGSGHLIKPAAGALAGAALGSVVPVIGTTAGAIGGAGLGHLSKFI